MPKRIMLIAGEPSGDKLAAELVLAIRAELAHHTAPAIELQPLHKNIAPRFFGAGGPAMAEAGVEIVQDMMGHAVTGFTEVLKKFFKFRRIFRDLQSLALERRPDLLIGVDFSEFNFRFANSLFDIVRQQAGTFSNWNPRIVRFVSPQVWAARAGRARELARTVDLLLSIIPFEKDWYQKRTPHLDVRFVGHPILDRYRQFDRRSVRPVDGSPIIALLPGSRTSELNRHLPPMLDAVNRIQAKHNVRFKMIVPHQSALEIARAHHPPESIEIAVGGIPELLSTATMAIASTGTVTLECAYFGVPTIAIYKTSLITFEIGKRLVTIDRMAMPNLIAREDLFPEFIQYAATGENISAAALHWLNNPEELAVVQRKLAEVVKSLGEPGAAKRAAHAVLDLF